MSSLAAFVAHLMPKRGGGARKATALILTLCGLALCGCYASPGLLLDTDDAVQPLVDGVYSRDGDPSDRYRITETADGWYRVEQVSPDGAIGETHKALFTPMTLDDGRAAFAIAEQTDDGYDYAVALITDGRVQLATPDCADPLDRNLAVDHGGQADDDDGMTPACTFHNSVALLSALAAFAGQADFGRPYQRH